MTKEFTEEEIKAAKSVKQTIIKERIPEVQSVYMAGEICMWDETRNKLEEKDAELSSYRSLLDDAVKEMVEKDKEIIEFAEWIAKENWAPNHNGTKWIGGAEYITTQELLTLYRQSKQTINK